MCYPLTPRFGPNLVTVVEDARTRAADKIAVLSRGPSDLVSFWREVTDVFTPVVPHFWSPCFFTMDPASLLVTSHFHEGLDHFPPEMLQHEYYGEDVHDLASVAASDGGLSTLHEAAGGDPSGSVRWQQNRAMGGDQEIIVRLRAGQGDTWGMLSLYREAGAPTFDDTDKAFLRSISEDLAQGARTAMLVGEATDPDVPDAPGLLVLDDAGELCSTTAEAERWLEELPGGTGGLPSAVQAVAGQVREGRPHQRAFARVRSRSGLWVLLHGSVLHDRGEHRIAVIIEPAHPDRIYPLLMAAYQLTERERDVTRLVLHGASTAQIAAELFLSPHTVQQHVKNVFAKTGVNSRRDLVGKIFFSHYEPRLRDNEQRVLADRPVRGGPVA